MQVATLAAETRTLAENLRHVTEDLNRMRQNSGSEVTREELSSVQSNLAQLRSSDAQIFQNLSTTWQQVELRLSVIPVGVLRTRFLRIEGQSWVWQDLRSNVNREELSSVQGLHVSAQLLKSMQ